MEALFDMNKKKMTLIQDTIKEREKYQHDKTHQYVEY